MTYSDSIKFIVAMIVMLNPLSSLSVFLQLTYRFTPHEQRHAALAAARAITIIMLITLWSGEELLTLLGITIPAFRVAGGIILLLTGLSMLESRNSAFSHTSADNEAAKERASIAIVPVALPLIVGPGAISTLIIAAGDYPLFLSKLWLSVLCCGLALVTGSMLYYAHAIARVVGTSVIKVINRIMGMVIMAIAVGMLAEGLTTLLPALHPVSS